MNTRGRARPLRRAMRSNDDGDRLLWRLLLNNMRGTFIARWHATLVSTHRRLNHKPTGLSSLRSWRNDYGWLLLLLLRLLRWRNGIWSRARGVDMNLGAARTCRRARHTGGGQTHYGRVRHWILLAPWRWYNGNCFARTLLICIHP